MASVRDFKAAFMVSVARIDFSRAESWSSQSCSFSWSAAFFPLDFVGRGLDFAVAVVLELPFFLTVNVSFCDGLFDFGRRRSDSVETVAGVQVVVDAMLSRIDFAVICAETMTIQKC